MPLLHRSAIVIRTLLATAFTGAVSIKIMQIQIITSLSAAPVAAIPPIIRTSKASHNFHLLIVDVSSKEFRNSLICTTKNNIVLLETNFFTSYVKNVNANHRVYTQLYGHCQHKISLTLCCIPA